MGGLRKLTIFVKCNHPIHLLKDVQNRILENNLGDFATENPRSGEFYFLIRLMVLLSRKKSVAIYQESDYLERVSKFIS